MDGLKMIYTRRSIRRFSSKPIDEDVISKIVKAGKLAPTARNVQPWEIVVIKDNNAKEQIAQTTDYGKFIKNAPLCIAVFCEDTKYFLEDSSAATQNILLAARYFNIASCWIAGDKKPYVETIREICKVKTGYRIISLIALGYPVNNDVFKERKIKNSDFTVI